jgi:hypothetical protein
VVDVILALAMQAPPDEKPPSSRHNPDAWMSGRSFKLDMPETLSAYKGAPPQVYGVLWNPYAEDEFITYGVKHLVTWRLGPDPNNPSGLPRWQSIAGTFGPTKVENVLAAAYVPDCMDKYRVRVDTPASPAVAMVPTASKDSAGFTAI